MATQTTEYITCKRLCCGVLPADVIVCVPSSIVAPHLCPIGEDGGEAAEQVTDFTYIEAQISKECKVGNACGRETWKYWITFDDAQLIEGAILTGPYITGIFCKDCWTDWVEELVGDEPYIFTDYEGQQTFVSPHGCQYDICPPAVIDSSTVDLTLVKTEGSDCLAIRADVILSDDEGNCLEARTDGLYGPCGEGDPFITAVEDTNEIDLDVTDGTLTATINLDPNGCASISEAGLLVPCLVVSEDPNNCLEDTPEGLFVPCPDAAFITAVGDTNTVDLTVTGTTLTADVEVSPDADNRLTAEANGLKVDSCADFENEGTYFEDVTAAVAGNLEEGVVEDITSNTATTTFSNGSACRTMNYYYLIIAEATIFATGSALGDIASLNFQLEEQVNGGGFQVVKNLNIDFHFATGDTVALDHQWVKQGVALMIPAAGTTIDARATLAINLGDNVDVTFSIQNFIINIAGLAVAV